MIVRLVLWSFALSFACSPAFAASPSAAQAAEFLERARAAALSYLRALPDFVCAENTYRYRQEPGGWHLLDRVAARLTYSGGRENRVILTSSGEDSSDAAPFGSFSQGEFGNALASIFKPESKTEFRWMKQTRSHGVETWQYSFDVAAANSGQVLASPQHDDQPVGLRGFIRLSLETARPVHLEFEATGIPKGFPVRSTRHMVEYADVIIGGEHYSMPARAEVHFKITAKAYIGAYESEVESRNTIEFRDYRKFEVETKLTFGEPTTAEASPASR